MATKSLVLTEEEWRAIAILVNNEEHDADQLRITQRPDSPQEKVHEATQKFWQGIQAKMAGRDSVTPNRITNSYE